MSTIPAHPLIPTNIPQDHLLRIQVMPPPAPEPSARPRTKVRPRLHRVAMAPRQKELLGAVPGFHTDGWDTVYALRLSDVNAIMTARWGPDALPTTWVADLPASIFSAALHGVGTFAPWKLTRGGSGALVRMEVPFTAVVTVSGGSSIQVTGGRAEIEVQLQYVPQGAAPAPAAVGGAPPFSGGERHALTMKVNGATQSSRAALVVSAEWATPVIDDPGQRAALEDALKRLLQKWFDENALQFKHVFATVDLGAHAAAGGLQWLLPTYVSYAYVDGPDDDRSLLGVLAMTENRAPTGAIQEISPGAIPNVPGATAGFSFSIERFLTKMVLPALPLEFSKVDATAFKVSEDETQIENTRNVPIADVKVGLISYHPVITSLRVTIGAGEIETYVMVHTEISPGIDAYAEMTHYAKIVSVTKADGTQTLSFKETKPLRKNSWYTVATWVVVTEIVADLILAVIACVFTAIESQIKNTIVKFIVAIVVGGVVVAILKIVEMIPEWIAEGANEALPSLDPLVDAGAGPTQWTGYRDFTIKGALMNGGLQLGGVPVVG